MGLKVVIGSDDRTDNLEQIKNMKDPIVTTNYVALYESQFNLLN